MLEKAKEESLSKGTGEKPGGMVDPRVKKIKKRADELLAEQGLARSRSQAQALIMAGEVKAGEQLIKKAGEFWPCETVFTVTARRRFVSRGGHKLEGALEDLSISPQNVHALDIGASTGGFTDCLLQSGAASVTALDVGRGLLDWTLRQDERVKVFEGINARDLTGVLSNQIFDLAVIDVSFISLALILPQVAPLMGGDGLILAMVKPQFEVGREKVGKKGVVKNLEDINDAVNKISALGPALNPPFKEVGRSFSRLLGPEGNREVFVLFSQRP